MALGVSCCVRTCINKSGIPGTTFYMFPKIPTQRALWLEALEMTDFTVTDRSVVCSGHFRKEDLKDYTGGRQSLIPGAIPVLYNEEDDIPVATWEELDAPAVTRICKICLALDVKTYDMREVYSVPKFMGTFKLNEMYENVTGISARLNKKVLPQRICWECAAQLAAAENFRAKALFSDAILLDMLKIDPCIKVRHVIHLLRNYSHLKTSLGIQNVVTNEEPCYNTKNTQNTIVKAEAIDPHQNNEIEIEIKDEDEIMYEFNENLNEIKTEIDLIPNEIEIPAAKYNDKFEEFIHFNHDIENDNNRTEHDIEVNKDDDADYDDRYLSEVVKENKDDRISTEVFVHVDKEETSVRKTTRKRKKSVKKQKITNNPGTSRRRVKKKGPLVKTKQPIDENIFTITTLTQEEQIEEIQRRKERATYKMAPYQCTVCYKGYPTEDKYKRHAVKHTEKCGMYECVICKIRVKKTWAMRVHMTRQHSEEFKCKQCPFVTRSRTVALAHVKFHYGTKYQCPQCSTEFEKKTTLLNHLRLKHISAFVCELCGYTFVSKMGVRSHKRMKHPLIEKDIKLEGPYCKACDVKFLSKKAYDNHLRLSSKHIESEDDPNRMSNDPSIKSRRIGLVRKKPEIRPNIHPKDPDDSMLVPNEPVVCEQCGIELENSRAYAYHFRVQHPGINRTKHPYIKNPYMCEQCGKMFMNTTSLENHMWVHTGEKRYECDHCHKMFSVKANLAAHIRQHTGPRQTYACRVCGKMFAFSFNRTRHMFLHTGEKPFKCDVCGKCFVWSGDLRAHVDHVHLRKPRRKRARRKPKNCDNITGIEY